MARMAGMDAHGRPPARAGVKPSALSLGITARYRHIRMRDPLVGAFFNKGIQT